jgi:hypothetical protein
MNLLVHDLFGMPLVVPAEDVTHAQRVLTTAWELQMGRRIGDLREDLDDLAVWFHPKLRGATLREKLVELEPLESLGTDRLPSLILLACGEDRFLVTPEGRAWLECSSQPDDKNEQTFVYSPDQGRVIESELLSIYRRWTRHRIADVVQKRTGEGSPMLPSAVALVLLLLVNRSLDGKSAIRRVREEEAQAKIDHVVADVIEAFADSLVGPSKRGRSRREFSLWSGYPLTEARRRLPGRLILDRAAGTVYVEASREREVVEFIGRDLARRREANAETVARAFEALVSTYRGRLRDLSGLGSGFERATQTDALEERLIEVIRSQS